MNYSSPGDTIEVYSGTYLEDEIQIVKDNIILLGISLELGEGDDTGKPFIKGIGNNGIIRLIASYVTVSNFIIEASGGVISECIWIENFGENEQNNITISDCILRSSIGLSTSGIQVEHVDNNIRIINNEISNCNVGIRAWNSPRGLKITGNVISDCEVGILLNCDQNNASGNKIRRCSRDGIQIHGTNNIVYGNDIDNCPRGIYRWGLRRFIEGGNTITKNNFKNYSWNEPWWERQVILFLFSGLVKDEKDIWIGNYWDTWKGVGPMRIRGTLFLGIGTDEYGIGFPIPSFDHDLNPAKEPYDIGS